MAVVSYNSFRGLRAIRGLNSGGAKLLAKNQLLLGTILLLYAGWNLYLLATGKFDLGISGTTGDEINEAGLGSWLSLAADAYYLLYIGLAVFALVGQGLTAFYYITRKKYIEEYLSRTAEWVLQMQKMGFRLRCLSAALVQPLNRFTCQLFVRLDMTAALFPAQYRSTIAVRGAFYSQVCFSSQFRKNCLSNEA